VKIVTVVELAHRTLSRVGRRWIEPWLSLGAVGLSRPEPQKQGYLRGRVLWGESPVLLPR